MNTFKTITLAVCIFICSVYTHAQQLTNGTGGGDWLSNVTWEAGSPPGNAATWSILGGDAVTAGAGVEYTNASSFNFIYGTLTLNSGASVYMRRLNPNVVSNGTLNIQGGSMDMEMVNLDASSDFTINMSSGYLGYRQIVSLSNGVTINQSGGLFEYNGVSFSTETVMNFTGGDVVFLSGYSTFNGAISRGSWNGGRLTVNTSSISGPTSVNTNLAAGWSSNPGNILALSSKDERQTLSLSTSGFVVNQGILEMRVYSADAHDSDQMLMTSNHAFSLAGNVELSLYGHQLTGNPEDYLGSTYRLFNLFNDDYSSIQATLTPTVWTIGGTDYDVSFINTLNSDGSLTVSGITVIPEPDTLVLMGLALGVLFLFRRRHS